MKNLEKNFHKNNNEGPKITIGKVLLWLFFWWIMIFVIVWKSNLTTKVKIGATAGILVLFIVIGAMGSDETQMISNENNISESSTSVSDKNILSKKQDEKIITVDENISNSELAKKIIVKIELLDEYTIKGEQEIVVRVYNTTEHLLKNADLWIYSKDVDGTVLGRDLFSIENIEGGRNKWGKTWLITASEPKINYKLTNVKFERKRINTDNIVEIKPILDINKINKKSKSEIKKILGEPDKINKESAEHFIYEKLNLDIAFKNNRAVTAFLTYNTDLDIGIKQNRINLLKAIGIDFKNVEERLLGNSYDYKGISDIEEIKIFKQSLNSDKLNYVYIVFEDVF